MSRTLLVLAHPRGDALTTQVAERTRHRLEAAGHTIDLLDLYAEDFDPRLTPPDEPDWENRDKVYSPEVRAHMARIEAADDIVVVFPVWWFSLPAVLKGWIDRVWNYGFAYGRSKPRLAGKRMLWLGLAGYSGEAFAKKGMVEVVDRQLRVGISEFSGIDQVVVHLLYGSELSGVPHALRAGRVQEMFAGADAALDALHALGAEAETEAAVLG
ncbi:NAD(P)H oxidoreductase [Streptomyces sp. NPDC051018]|uniref:NAD(P)H oxidoreductase n=1 Tax=Streptomyces sp. NPDC051018 TaxID=3365639 RepID=UPI003795B817